MKIKKLIKKIQNLDGNLDVILSSDEEGNSFRLLNEVNLCSDEFDGENFEDNEVEDENEGDSKDKTIKSVILF